MFLYSFVSIHDKTEKRLYPSQYAMDDMVSVT